LKADIIIYGGTSAAVISVVQAQRMGRSVIVVSPDKHLGGLSSGGLGWTDTGDKSVIGGVSREFYQRVWQYYNQPESWKWQKQSEYGNRGQGISAIDEKSRTMWIFEPHIAERVFEDFIGEHNIKVFRDEWLDREHGVEKEGNRIRSMTTLNGKTFKGKIFIDATYEGDLMATAGVSYHIGREANSVYNETYNGIQVGVLHHTHHFGKRKISPYVKPGDPSSGLLQKISSLAPGKRGDGDHRVQAYNFRMCLTNHPDNRVSFTKPDGYDPNQYELLVRVLNSGWDGVFKKFDPLPNRKTDTNNHGPLSTDNIGMNYDYPDASYQRRLEIIKEHETYQKGLLYFLANDPQVPDSIRNRMSEWGLAKDEFVDNENWPHQLYIREARRMIGEYVLTENDVLGKRKAPKPIGVGSYTMDSHNVQRYVTPEGFVQNEGDIGVHPRTPYPISYDSITPKKREFANLLVPVSISSSHIAYGSIRMEPVFMILGQSAATAASIAIDDDVAVQDVNYPKLRQRLLEDNQHL
jgi:FAD dependent oxidoreductase